MGVEALIPLKAAFYRQGLVRGVVIEDQAGVEIDRYFRSICSRKRRNSRILCRGIDAPMFLPSSMSSAANRVAVPLITVVVDHGASAAPLHRRRQLNTVERLDLALLVYRKCQYLVGQVEANADHILDLRSEVGFHDILERLIRYGLMPCATQNLAHRRRRDLSYHCPHCPKTPVGAVRRFLVERQIQNLPDRLGRQWLASRRSGVDLEQPFHPPRRKAQRQRRAISELSSTSLSAAPTPSAANSAIRDRHTGFRGVFADPTSFSNLSGSLEAGWMCSILHTSQESHPPPPL